MSYPKTSKKDSNIEKDLFYFESDHLALRGNKDYNDLLKTIAILEAQREGAIKDIDKIIETRKKAIENPLDFIKKIKNHEDIGVPSPQIVAEIPEINWAKYNVPIPGELFRLINQDKSIDNKVEISKKAPKKPKNKDNHSSTFSKPWSAEEQKKLEELLVKYPSESVEVRRYKKIADALGDRTVQQVTSRVQKYFKKLYKAGLPIPGRIPKSLNKNKKIHKHQKNNSYLYKQSTFFPDLNVPVFMSENDDEIPGANVLPPTINTREQIEKKDEVLLKIELLKRVKIEKEFEKSGSVFYHIGFKCDICNEEPIIGSRWHCLDCRQDSIDFCTDCIVSQLNSTNFHPLEHKIVPLRNDETLESSESLTYSEPSTSAIKSEPTSDLESDSQNSSSSEDDISENDTNKMFVNSYDKDYVSNSFTKTSGTYNYLDPNFLPE